MNRLSTATAALCIVLLATVATASAAGANTYLACESQHSSAVFKAELRIRPYNCLALGGSHSSTNNLAHMQWSRWNSHEALGSGVLIAGHGEEVEGQLVFRRYPIRVRLSRPGHACDGSQANFGLLEWQDQFGKGRDVKGPTARKRAA